MHTIPVLPEDALFARALVTLGDSVEQARHIKWAKAIARGVRQHYRFKCGSQEEQELEGSALAQLWRLAAKFDPDRVPEGGSFYGAFHGWAHPFIRGECQREARRLRNGGTYHTRYETDKEPVGVEELPWRHGDCGDEYVDLADHREQVEEMEPVMSGVEYVTDAAEEVALPSPKSRCGNCAPVAVGDGQNWKSFRERMRMRR